MRLLYFTLLLGLAVTLAATSNAGNKKAKNKRSATETPDSSTETPDTSTETPNSDTETPETPETPSTTADIPDTPETPDTKAVVPNSPHSNDINIDDEEESGSGLDHDNVDSSPAFGKKSKNSKHHEKSADKAGKKDSKPIVTEKATSNKGSKKQILGYPEPDDRQQGALGDFGQGGPPGPGFGGLGRGGLGSEMEGMPVGMGGGGEPLGFREQGGPGSNFHIPGIAQPSNYEENAEVGRNSDDENSMISRYAEKEDIDSMTQNAISRVNSIDDGSESPYNKDLLQSNEEPDESVTKAIGRPFEPDGEPAGNMEDREDSPFQNVKQESPFQIPMNNLAAQASYAQAQMSRFRPESAGPLGQQQEESPFQPESEDQPEAPGYGGAEGGDFRATSMNGAEALMGMNEQGGTKRHHTKQASRKRFLKAIKRKGISKQKKSKLKNINS